MERQRGFGEGAGFRVNLYSGDIDIMGADGRKKSLRKVRASETHQSSKITVERRVIQHEIDEGVIPQNEKEIGKWVNENGPGLALIFIRDPGALKKFVRGNIPVIVFNQDLIVANRMAEREERSKNLRNFPLLQLSQGLLEIYLDSVNNYIDTLYYLTNPKSQKKA